MSTAIHAVTGAYGYSGKYIAQRLLDQGHTVITLTNSLSRANPFGTAVRAMPFDFDRPDLLAEHLQGVSVLYNTYWVRFNHRLFQHADAVRNTLTLFAAARKAGVRRIVHVSITNPSEDSPLEYFRGKATLEKALVDSGISYAILRPAVLFGKEDILINNIAWTLRRFPVFALFGDGRYRLQTFTSTTWRSWPSSRAAVRKTRSSTRPGRKRSPIRSLWRRSAGPSAARGRSSPCRLGSAMRPVGCWGGSSATWSSPGTRSAD